MNTPLVAEVYYHTTDHDIPLDEGRLDQLFLARNGYHYNLQRLQDTTDAKIEYEKRWHVREAYRDGVETRSLEVTWYQASLMQSQAISEHVIDEYVIGEMERLETERQEYFDRIESCIEQLTISEGLYNLDVLNAREVMDSLTSHRVADPDR